MEKEADMADKGLTGEMPTAAAAAAASTAASEDAAGIRPANSREEERDAA